MAHSTFKLYTNKKVFLVLLMAIAAFSSQIAFAWNPDINQIIIWHATSKDAKYGSWVSQPKSSGKGYLFSKKQRNKLQNWYKSQKWSKIEKFINKHGGSNIVTTPNPQPTTSSSTDLSQTPLFLTAGVEPNINFILDDSGSMNWEAMIDYKTVDLAPFEGLPVLLNKNGKKKAAAYLVPQWTPTSNYYFNNTIPPVTIDPKAWMAKNTIANPLYYDSTSTYYPWPGTDANGNPLYKDANPYKAMQKPYAGSFSKTIDLTKNQTYYYKYVAYNLYLPVFYTWDDTNDNGIVDKTDAHTRVEIKPGNEKLFSNGRSYAEELQNFANWFQYYRNREFGAKVAISTVINDASATRMGLELINKGHIDDISSMDNQANKIGLMKNLYKITSGYGTPLRKALQKSGEMFKGNTNAPSPILSYADGGSCQQNFQVLMTDGFWNGNSPNVGNTDGDNNTDFDGGYYADNYSNTLADVAMYYYEKDLSALKNEVPTQKGIDENNAQHLVTYTIGFGVTGKLDPELDPKKGEVTWPKVSDSLSKVDDLWHAAFNGRGQYLNAAYPEVLSDALNKIIDDIKERTANTSAVAINSAKLTTETALYVAEFNASRWQGEIYAFKIANLETGELNKNPTWAAGATLTKRDLLKDPRVIITSDGIDGLPFQWDELKTNQKDDFYTTPSGGTSSESTAQARLAFIRGDRSNEGKTLGFRTRSNLLGDVVNSGPVYVQKPDLTWPDFAPFPTASGSRYSDFVKANKDRKGVVYVGANDGMLHAFDAATKNNTDDGSELFAYVPNILYSSNVSEGLHYLSDPSYKHIFYNDLTPSISDVYLKTKNSTGKQWSTLLIGGLRRGGRGIYALDVTDPGKFKNETTAKDIALWEFSDQNDPDLGYTYSKPQIALGNNGKWLAIFGNGYNDLGSGESSLFIVDIEAASDGSWDAGDYIKISTGSGSPTDKNGLSTPALADIDGNGTVDRVYAGDLKGQLWVFDLNSASSTAWKLANTTPLITTKGARPITAQPALSFHPTVKDSTSNKPNVLVFFGDGSYLTTADRKDTTSENHFYGVWDSGTSNLNYNHLVEQTFDSSFTSARVLTSKSVDYATKFGWFITLPIAGERSVTKAVVRFDVVFFNTFIPTNSPCSSGGYGFKMAVDSATGGALKEPAFDTNNDGVVDVNDTVSNSSDTKTSTIAGIKQEDYLPEPVFIEDLMFTAKTPTKVKAAPNKKSGRLSWQELIE